MKIVEVKSVSSKPNPHNVDARSISDTQSAQVVHITLQPGESLKKHITPVDVVFYVLEGRGVVEIGEERSSVAVDTLIESPAKIGLRNPPRAMPGCSRRAECHHPGGPSRHKHRGGDPLLHPPALHPLCQDDDQRPRRKGGLCSELP